ncbi:SdiA-regulated domain-containing protein [Methylomonas rivi]|uniref:SdiA-regulated domain-containing protein n=1 Tax=Methylomonas rivi TaxID=2952226 RepID=A0ABT1U9E7_9GAMM|nr:SdiA-regulated domain-containing protein [Methylomonas sp. WSC-6]MCQ8130483.1 SdiA-regulated domain-containing protein [Methylomonas sp. WSC-6]
MKLNTLFAAISFAVFASGANAAASLNLVNYQLTGNYALDTLGGMGLEASAVTYARDRNSLFVVGDEGLGVVEVSLTGQTLGTMAFNWTSTGSTNNDAEGLTYLGNGQLVVVDERPQIAYQFGYNAGGTVDLNNQPKVAITGSTVSVGNVGTEGISFDPRDGSFYSVKQDNSAQLRKSTLNFAAGFGTATTTTPFSGTSSLFGLNSLSDVQTLSPIDSLAASAAADNLLILSLDSKMLAEISPFTGQVLSSFDLASVTAQAIEGVTVDYLGNIYLVAENNGTSYTNSRLFVLTPTAVPVPGAVWLFGSALIGFLKIGRKKV